MKKIESIPGIKIKLLGEDGNAFFILGRVVKEMKKANISNELIERYKKEATEGDYNHLLKVTQEYVEII